MGLDTNTNGENVVNHIRNDDRNGSSNQNNSIFYNLDFLI